MFVMGIPSCLIATHVPPFISTRVDRIYRLQVYSPGKFEEIARDVDPRTTSPHLPPWPRRPVARILSDIGQLRVLFSQCCILCVEFYFFQSPSLLFPCPFLCNPLNLNLSDLLHAVSFAIAFKLAPLKGDGGS